MLRPTSRGGRTLIALAAFCAFAASPGASSSAQSSAQSSASSSPVQQKAPPPATAWAGDAACAECHAAEASTYSGTTHAHDSSQATAKTILGNFTTGQNILRTADPHIIFAMIAAPDGYYQSAMNIADPQHVQGAAERIDIVIGSGRRGQTYLYWVGDKLFELPVSWWTETHEWINSPGYMDGKVNFERPAEPRCLECHASYFQTQPPPANRFDPRTLVLGIGCERCHGPGALHVAREKSAHPPAAGSPDIAIVNPARLSTARQMDVCADCHAGPGEPTAPALSFEPGDTLAKYVKIATPPPDAPVDAHGNQVQALEHSKCFASGKLTCATCHNVHRTQENAEAFSRHCMTCHTVQACGRFRQMGSVIQGKCIDCHMPMQRSGAVTASSDRTMLRAQMRTHRIAIYPEASAQ